MLPSLTEEIRWLGKLLGEVITDLDGADSFALEEMIRRLAKQRRAGDEQAAAELRQAVCGLSLDESWLVCRAFSIFFDLSNLAEDRHRVRILREREQEKSVRSESITAAVHAMQGRGLAAEQVQGLLDRLCVEPVFTAHPTEAKRRSVRNALRRIRELLGQLDHSYKRPREASRLHDRLREELEILWLTDPLLDRKPTVLEEVDRGLYFMGSLWRVIPRLHRDLCDALQEVYPQGQFQVPAYVQFGTWMGGDRDGNPFVTSQVTSETLRKLRRKALRLHRREARRLEQRLTHSELRISAAEPLLRALQEALWQWPKLERHFESVSSHEVHRRWCLTMDWRLRQSLLQLKAGGSVAGAYQHPQQLLDDLQLLTDSLGPRSLGLIESWRVRLKTFGFHLASLDIRQESGIYNRAATTLQSGQSPVGDDELQEVKALFHLLQWAHQRYGPAALGCHILSMTHSSQDILNLFWLQRHLAPGLNQPLVPLLETISDLRRGPEILKELFSNPDYRSYLKNHCGNLQRVMIGYSDSTKDGGYLAANWSLYEAQSAILEVATQFQVSVQFFHGRGGALGRGGGPAARSIVSLPPGSCTHGLRITEQGEVLSARYDDPLVAQRHLEQLTWAMLEVLGDGQGAGPVPSAWKDQMALCCENSRVVYRALVEAPGFIDFFRQASPIDGIEHLQIGSRPSRRGGPIADLTSLRAIPWVFSWTQNRTLLPAWYGLGSGLKGCLSDSVLLGTFRDMYRDWPFFTALVDNAALALAKADLGIVREYANDLQGDAAKCWTLLELEYRLTVEALTAITGQQKLLDSVPWLQRSIAVRNPYVDPLNLVQIQTLAHLRDAQSNQEAEQYRTLLRMTIQGIAGGLRTTG